MQYREFGKTGISVSAVGMGANRFQPSDLKTSKGLEQCAQIMVNAAKAGVNFFDSATTYSSGKCETILKLALPQIKSKCYICGKSSSYQEKNKDAVLQYIENSLQNIGIDYFDFYYMWSVKSFKQYQFIMSKGGPFEGVLAAKDRGIVKHICFSSHAPASDTIQIIQEGAFEGVLTSFSLLNFRENGEVLKAAEKFELGVAVMNPLGGGIIPQNEEIFSDAYIDGDRDLVDSALKFVYASSAVSTVLCGVGTNAELQANIQSLSSADQNMGTRVSSVHKRLGHFSDFCTGCNYCIDCPAELPISQLMTAYNQTKFKTDTSIYGIISPELRKRERFFRKLDGQVVFKNSENPCIKCGKCMEICTQSLPIVRTIEQIYTWVAQSCVSITDRKKRFQNLIHADYRRVGFYTAGVYTSYILNLYQQLFGGFNFEIYVFDSNPQRWGQKYLEDLTVKSPKEIPQLDLDVLVISNYIHGDSIYNELLLRFPSMNIKKLHDANDLPWML